MSRFYIPESDGFILYTETREGSTYSKSIFHFLRPLLQEEKIFKPLIYAVFWLFRFVNLPCPALIKKSRRCFCVVQVSLPRGTNSLHPSILKFSGIHKNNHTYQCGYFYGGWLQKKCRAGWTLTRRVRGRGGRLLHIQ